MAISSLYNAAAREKATQPKPPSPPKGEKTDAASVQDRMKEDPTIAAMLGKYKEK